MDSHRAAFVAEAEEGITDLNNALLALEADPEDDEAMDDVFRVAHTLKGNAAAMGFEEVSSFGHALEDLLDAVRSGGREVTPELMDLLFEGVDTVEALIAEIDDDGDVTTDPSELESRLRAVEEHGRIDSGDGNDADSGSDDTTPAHGDVDNAGIVSGDVTAGDPPGDTDDNGSTGATEIPTPPSAVADLEGSVVYAKVTVGNSAMPGVDAALITQALDGQFDEFVTDPSPEALEDGEYGDGFDVFVSETDPDAVAQGLGALTQVDSATVAVVDDEAADDGTRNDRGGSTGNEDSTGNDDSTGNEDSTGNDDSTGNNDSTGDDSTDDRGTTGGTAGRDEINSIRVDVDQVDELYGLVEQLVTSRIKLRRELEGADAEPDTLDELDKLASSLQDTAMDMRLIPFSQVADSFPRLVRDIARDLDRRVRFEIKGDDVELDRTILTEMRDPLVHVLRNAVDHGIEPPAEREAAGKDPVGEVTLTAERERDHVIIEVDDDGDGIDADRLREKAIDEDVESRETIESMSDDEVYDLVFHPGFSTAAEVTDVSGRGVGMDVVRTTARDLDGSVSVDSEPGEGTTVRFRLPVTVAIVKVMFVDVAGTEYGIPIKSIAEVSRADGIEEVHGDEVVRHEDDLYPVVRLGERLEGKAGSTTTDPSADTTGESDETAATDGGAVDGDFASETVDGPDGNGMLVRIREETRTVALHCDGVLDQEEVVVKPLDGPLSGTPGLSGTAVLGDGDVVAVLDVMSL